MSAIIRAVLDYRSYITPSVLAGLVKTQWEKVKETFTTLPNNFSDTLLAAYTVAVTAIKAEGLEHSTMKNVEPAKLIERMVKYYMYGDAAFLNPSGQDHYLEKNSTAENSLVLHRRYSGMITI